MEEVEEGLALAYSATSGRVRHGSAFFMWAVEHKNLGTPIFTRGVWGSELGPNQRLIKIYITGKVDHERGKAPGSYGEAQGNGGTHPFFLSVDFQLFNFQYLDNNRAR